MSDNDQQAFRAAIGDLPFDPDEETVEDCLDTVDELYETASQFSADHEPPTVAHSRSDDEYNALLDVYETPRQEGSGRLDGVSFVVKDNIQASGLPLTCGLDDFSFTSSSDATVVERLLDAGATLHGKANMEPLAVGPTGDHSDFGTVQNPVADGHISGGSSSGSGAAVAAGLVDAALGTDTGGSVRIPAACCGLVGIKPTFGLVPRDGFVDFLPSTDTIGPITKRVDTATEFLETMAGHSPRDPTSSQVDVESVFGDHRQTSLTVGVVQPLLEAATGDVQTAVEEAVSALDTADTSVQRLDPDVEFSEIVHLYPFLTAEFVWFLRQSGVTRGQGTGYDEAWRRAFQDYLDEHTLSDYIASRVLPGAYLDRETDGRIYTLVRQAITDIKRALASLFQSVDVLLTPTLPLLPPRYDELDEVSQVEQIGQNTAPFSLAGTPAVAVPVASAGPLPASVQLVAPQFQDGVAIEAARRVEQRCEQAE